MLNGSWGHVEGAAATESSELHRLGEPRAPSRSAPATAAIFPTSEEDKLPLTVGCVGRPLVINR